MAARSLENQRFAFVKVLVSLGHRDRQPKYLALKRRLVHLGRVTIASHGATSYGDGSAPVVVGQEARA
jgi:hypothetical protein